MEYLAQENERDSKADWAIAQLAAEIRRGQVKHPRTVQVQDFLIKMKRPETKKAKSSKAVWASALNLQLKEP